MASPLLSLSLSLAEKETISGTSGIEKVVARINFSDHFKGQPCKVVYLLAYLALEFGSFWLRLYSFTVKEYVGEKTRVCFFFLISQYFEDAHTTEKKMIQLVDRLNTEYDVQNISSREAAKQALDRLTVSASEGAIPKIDACCSLERQCNNFPITMNTIRTCL